jgi:NADH-quinone oxidoreductase subunit L
MTFPFSYLWLIPAFPLIGFLVQVLLGARLPRVAIAAVGVGSVGLSALTAVAMGYHFVMAPPAGHAYTQVLFSWIELPGFAPNIALYLDALSLLMVLVVTIVGFLIHVYSAEYMIDDTDYCRFFAYMNLFVAAMLTLVLADNLALLYVGWEGVGLCSYLLIGFWYEEAANANAAIKAFIMTRLGDIALIIGIFLISDRLGTLRMQEVMQLAQQQWAVGSAVSVAAAALILGGALGKSAQLPLQTWLPDAMAGPTPVSALIHAATMVTAGVYLIARMHVMFTLAPAVQAAVAVIGTLTLLVAGFSALAQSDIKRVLAYSTISQIGYMFLALGVGAWSAAMFHFFTHAFFKSLLFLGAGTVILAAHHEQNMFKLGGLRALLPVTFWTFLVGTASLAAIPLVTNGFYSKDLILWSAWSSPLGSPWLWAGGMLGAVLTALYSFRMVFLTFFGPRRIGSLSHEPGLLTAIPLVVLAVLSVVTGFIELPHSLGHVQWFSEFLSTALPAAHVRLGTEHQEAALQVIAAVGCLGGLIIAYVLFLRNRRIVDALTAGPVVAAFHRFLSGGCGFDRLYDALFVRPYWWIATVNRNDGIDWLYRATALAVQALHLGLSLTQTGKVRDYATGIAIGAVVAIGIAVFL